MSKKILIGVLILVLSCLCACGIEPLDVHIFADINECQRIQTLMTMDAELKVFTSPQEDKHLKDLEYQEFFGCEYSSEELAFELFAYEFANGDTAITYFKNATGKENNPNPTFSNSSAMGVYDSVVVNGNKAYSVRCKATQKEKVTEFLNGIFTAEVAGSDSI